MAANDADDYIDMMSGMDNGAILDAIQAQPTPCSCGGLMAPASVAVAGTLCVHLS